MATHDEPLVECVVCGAIVGPDNAEERQVAVDERTVKVWICNTCMRIGRGNQIEKYIMKEGKTIGR